MVCPNCNQVLEQGDRFCPACGTSIPTADTTPPVPPLDATVGAVAPVDIQNDTQNNANNNDNNDNNFNADAVSDVAPPPAVAVPPSADEQDMIVPPAKKSKKGLIIGILIAIIVLCTAATVTILGFTLGWWESLFDGSDPAPVEQVDKTADPDQSLSLPFDTLSLKDSMTINLSLDLPPSTETEVPDNIIFKFDPVLRKATIDASSETEDGYYLRKAAIQDTTVYSYEGFEGDTLYGTVEEDSDLAMLWEVWSGESTVPSYDAYVKDGKIDWKALIENEPAFEGIADLFQGGMLDIDVFSDKTNELIALLCDEEWSSEHLGYARTKDGSFDVYSFEFNFYDFLTVLLDHYEPAVLDKEAYGMIVESLEEEDDLLKAATMKATFKTDNATLVTIDLDMYADGAHITTSLEYSIKDTTLHMDMSVDADGQTLVAELSVAKKNDTFNTDLSFTANGETLAANVVISDIGTTEVDTDSIKAIAEENKDKTEPLPGDAVECAACGQMLDVFSAYDGYCYDCYVTIGSSETCAICEQELGDFTDGDGLCRDCLYIAYGADASFCTACFEALEDYEVTMYEGYCYDCYYERYCWNFDGNPVYEDGYCADCYTEDDCYGDNNCGLCGDTLEDYEAAYDGYCHDCYSQIIAV